MRSRGHFWLPVALSSALLFTSTADAETIRITSGFLEVGEPFTVRSFLLVGDRRGFTLFGPIGNRGFAPLCQDVHGDCFPETVARVQHRWSSFDFTGIRATLDGIGYEEINSAADFTSAKIVFDNAVELPPFNGSTSILRTPFEMEGSFQAPFVEERLVGSGIMTTTWERIDFPEGPSTWALAFTRYDFFGGAPIPEPTTLVLAGVGGVTAALARRRPRGR